MPDLSAGFEAVVYGIESCDQCRKARQWLKRRGLNARFQDLRAQPPDAGLLARWLRHVPWDALLNRRSLTWRALPPEDRQQVVDEATLVELLLREPLLIKRPVLESGEHLLLGFSEAAWVSALGMPPSNQAAED